MTAVTSLSIIEQVTPVVVIAAPYGAVGPRAAGTSQTLNTIGAGTKSFTLVEYGLSFVVGQRIRATAGTDLWMEGVVQSFNKDTNELVVLVDLTKGGAGTYGPWSIGIAGERGAQGPQGFQGNPGIPEEAPSTGQYYARRNAAWTPINGVFAPLASPAFSGTVTAPTPAAGDNSQNVATTAFVAGYQPLDADLTSLAAATVTTKLYYRKAVNSWVPLTLGSGLTLDTATDTLNVSAGGGNVSAVGSPVNLQLAQWTSTNTIQGINISGLGYASLASPAFTGNPTAPTPAAGDNDTSLATTAFVVAAIATAAGVAATTQRFTTTGAYTPTSPNVKWCMFILKGGGGSGAHAVGPSTPYVHGGGGGEGETIWKFAPVATFSGQTINIGLGGVAPGGFNTDGNAGGPSYISGMMSAAGGGGGSRGSYGGSGGVGGKGGYANSAAGIALSIPGLSGRAGSNIVGQGLGLHPVGGGNGGAPFGGAADPNSGGGGAGGADSTAPTAGAAGFGLMIEFY